MSPPRPRPKDPRRPILIAGLGLLAVSAGLYAAPASRAFSPWFLVAGAVLVLLYFVLRRVAAAPGTRRAADTTLFRDSTQLGDPSDDRRR
jgi:hypothetical protein